MTRTHPLHLRAGEADRRNPAALADVTCVRLHHLVELLLPRTGEVRGPALGPRRGELGQARADLRDRDRLHACAGRDVQRSELRPVVQLRREIVELRRPQDRPGDGGCLDHALLREFARVVVVRDAVDAHDREHHDVAYSCPPGGGEKVPRGRGEELRGRVGRQGGDVRRVDHGVDVLEGRVQPRSAHDVDPGAAGEHDRLVACGADGVDGRAAHGAGSPGDGDSHRTSPLGAFTRSCPSTTQGSRM
nr:hypothetical protein GCM10025699_15080 [Microbacterium flavescens]